MNPVTVDMLLHRQVGFLGETAPRFGCHALQRLGILLGQSHLNLFAGVLWHEGDSTGINRAVNLIFAFCFVGPIARFVPFAVACDICQQRFFAEPDNILPVFTLEEWEECPAPGTQPEQYIFVCQVCEPNAVKFYESDD